MAYCPIRNGIPKDGIRYVPFSFSRSFLLPNFSLSSGFASSAYPLFELQRISNSLDIRPTQQLSVIFLNVGP